MSTRDILAELPALADRISHGVFDVDARPVPLADVASVWGDTRHATHRLVLTPGTGTAR